MNNPKVSIVLPVYNAERFLKEALDSLVYQTFADFEVLAIDDGSTDGSAAIIKAYSDHRIQYLQNDRNRGIVYTLNRGIDLARGTYLARMDADDICHPERLAAQVDYLKENSSIAVVASFVDMIDADGQPLPPWQDDREHYLPGTIRARLLRTNCIAHPSIMARTAVMRSYHFRAEQKEAEDYDLWLRMVADGLQIGKVQRPLLRYRVLTSGLTRKENLSGFERQARTKRIFLAERRSNNAMNAYTRTLCRHYYWDLVRAFFKKLLKR
ncbi:MAG: glycosyltransferase [Chitinophagaceae bacterium]|nr:MAG: glycosyltransferase [Chitinophagaceae bacterium]